MRKSGLWSGPSLCPLQRHKQSACPGSLAPCQVQVPWLPKNHCQQEVGICKLQPCQLSEVEIRKSHCAGWCQCQASWMPWTLGSASTWKSIPGYSRLENLSTEDAWALSTIAIWVSSYICNENLELKILRCLFSAFFCFWGTLFSPLHEFSSLKFVGYLLYYASLLQIFDNFFCWIFII